MATLLKVSKEKEMEKSSMTAEDIRNKLFYFHQAAHVFHQVVRERPQAGGDVVQPWRVRGAGFRNLLL